MKLLNSKLDSSEFKSPRMTRLSYRAVYLSSTLLISLKKNFSHYYTRELQTMEQKERNVLSMVTNGFEGKILG